VPLEATMVTVTSRGLGPPYRRFAHRVRKRLARPGVRASLDPFLYGTTMATLTPERVRRELDIWQSFEQAFVVGHASGIHWIADQIRRQGIQLRRPPVAIATNADMLDPHAHAAIEATFGVRVHTRYGSREMNRIATSLPGTIDRYAFNPFLVYAEVVDDAGRPVPPGVPGRLALTDLNNLVMPLIRYDLGDIAIASDEIAGGFPVIEQILGRSSEVLTLPSGKVLATVTIGNVLFLEQDMGSWVRFYQCAQTAENELELRVVWEDEPPPGLRERMVELLGSAADPDTVIRVRDVDDVGRLPSGKVWVVRREF
ncbi:MAG TPA: hypothetical protein VM638_06120, partial [Actinomycetota bacterium]|nr:hypothetical protein [Actinomycetota bacterium]